MNKQYNSYKVYLFLVFIISTLTIGCSSIKLGGDYDSVNDRLVQHQLKTSADEIKHIMILGTYHFGNPGLDLNNMEADDVLSERRQVELEVLSETLAMYNPTVIVIEGTASPPYDDPSWKTYKDLDLKKHRSEVVQIGYRLASHLGLNMVYAVDEQPMSNEPDYFPYNKVATLAKKQGRMKELERISNSSVFLQKMEKMQAKSSIPELLAWVNGDQFPDDLYWNIIRFGEGEVQPGAELAGLWFMRNAKIFNKIDQVSRLGDRILVIFGAGHGHWLREIAKKSDGYMLVPVLPYLHTAADHLRNK